MNSTTRRSILVPLTLALLCGCGDDLPERTATPLRINEVNPHNPVYQDIVGDTDDWIELYNLSDQEFQLEGYYISDSPKKRFKDRFVTQTVVPAKGMLLLWADGELSENSYRSPHLSFKLSDQGEGVWLSTPEGYLIDKVEFAKLPLNPSGGEWTSYQRFPDGAGTFEWCSESTPDALNGKSCSGSVL